MERWRRIPVPARHVVIAARHLGHPTHRPHPHVRLALADGIAVLRYDDGKVNALSRRGVRALTEALADVRRRPEARALVLTGRPGQFCAGFDLGTLMIGGHGRDALIRAGWTLIADVLTLPLPVVTACPGNAIAGGAALLLAGDVRVGTQGAFRIGFNEAAIGLPLPGALITLVADRLGDGVVEEATRGARIYAPEEALDAGFLHRLTAPGTLLDVALAEAGALAASPVFAEAKAARAGRLAARMREQLPADLQLIERIGA